MAMHKRALALATAVVIAGAAQAEAATLRQFAMKANTICAATEMKLGALKEPQSPKQLAPYLRKARAVYKPAQTKLEALELPDEKRSTAERAISLSAKGMALVDGVIKDLEAGKAPEIIVERFEVAAERLIRSESKAWRSVGARRCAD